MRFGVSGSVLRVHGLGFVVWGLGFGVWRLSFLTSILSMSVNPGHRPAPTSQALNHIRHGLYAGEIWEWHVHHKIVVIIGLQRAPTYPKP